MSEFRFDQPQNVDAGYHSSHNSKPPFIDNEKTIELMHYYRLMLRNLWKIILFSLVIGGFSVFYALSLPPVYFSKATLLIESQQPNVLSFQDVYQVDTRDRSYIQTQLQILQSRSLISKVVDDLQLTRHPMFDLRQAEVKGSQFSVETVLALLGLKDKQEDSGASEDELFRQNAEGESLESDANSSLMTEEFIRKRAIGIVMNSLVVFPLRGTKIVIIQYSAQDPQLAADIANAFVDAFIDSQLDAKLQVTQKATSWLSERLGDLRQNLRASEQALQTFREEEQLVDTGDIRSIDIAELEQLTQALVQTTQEKNAARQLFLLTSRKNVSLDQLLSLPAISENPVIRGLIDTQVQANRLVAELSKRYGQKHPQMLSAVSDVNQASDELRLQVETISKGFELNYSAARDREQALKNQVDQVKDRIQQVSRKEFSLRELEREVEANRQVYEVFLNRGKETNETANLETVNARVVDPALPAEYPSKPEKKKIVMFAVLFAFGFASGIVLLLDWLDNTIKTPDDVEDRLSVPLLGFLPLDKSNKDATPFLGFLSEEKWHFAEAVRTIRTSFILSGLDKPSKITVVTSSVPNEGKSTVSLCLAHALGQMEKVLLIDADMRKPSIGKALDISLLTPGLSNLIAGTAELEECITRLPNSEVHVVTAGVVLGNPLDLIAGDRFPKVLEMLKEKYDRILIDSAPIQAVSDSIVISTYADALIYVVKSDGSSTPVVKKGLRRLSEANARFSGVILNQVDIDKMKKQSGYESEYYDNYGYAYGDMDESNK